jgi:hypothetical protein
MDTSCSTVFEAIKIGPGDPRFYARVFRYVSGQLKEVNGRKGDNLYRVVVEEYADLSRRCDKSLFQESCQIRNNLRTRRLANLLISDEGELNLEAAAKVIRILKEHCYFLGPGYQYDAPRSEHILHILEKLVEDKSLQRQLKQISKPYSHNVADQIIRDTLELPQNQYVTDAHAKRAALSSLLCYLRQNVGSCFATAPAILVQREEPETFLKDINELLGTGRIKRTFGGVEYAVPLTTSFGVGDFKKHVQVDASNGKMVGDLGLSPGILLALEAVGLIDREKPLKEKMEENRKFVQDAVQVYIGNSPYLLISPEQILKFLLMRRYQITAKDLVDYENRPREMLQTSIMMSHPIVSSGMGGKGEGCASYLAHMKIAQVAFNSLSENAMLKAWEYTLASFAETKPGFTRWNMYASLGFDRDMPGGFGAILYSVIKDKLEQSNAKVKDIQYEYEMLFAQLKYLETRMRSVATEKDAQWVRVEYESKRSEFRTLETLRDREHYKSERFASLINDLLASYDELFPKYFQEVYDADMHEVNLGPYDDSPAGFRLLYKHGRTNTAQWTLIYTPQEFIESLSSFLVATETELVNAPEYDGLQQDISEIATRLITHVKTDEFIVSAFQRMAQAHNTPFIKNPLENLDKIDKKPWAYTSGGTMQNLMSCYFRIEGKPKEVDRWVENPMELLIYLIDTVKTLPPKIRDELMGPENKALLMHSPTHAFSLNPTLPSMKEAIDAEGFSYTWVRDQMVKNAISYVEYHFMDPDMIEFLLEKLKEFVPENFRPRFQTLYRDMAGKKNPPEFRRALIFAMENDRGLQIRGEPVLSRDLIDSALFRWLPLFSYQELKNRSEKLLLSLPELKEEDKASISSCLDEVISRWGQAPFVTASQLQGICKTVLCMVLQDTSVSVNYPYLISAAAQKLGYAMPQPIIFADTNWVKDWFAFLVNPGTGELDLWRVDLLGSEGAPMSMWRHWLNGSDKERKWGVFINPVEYHA